MCEDIFSNHVNTQHVDSLQNLMVYGMEIVFEKGDGKKYI